MWVCEVGEDTLLPHQLAVHDHRQVDVEDNIVVDGETQHDANQGELAVILKWRRVEPETMRLFRIDEHACTDTNKLTDCTHVCWNKTDYRVTVYMFI